MKKIAILIAGIFSLSAFAGFADNAPGSDDSSGCGYGWEVTKGKTLSASSTRATTNATASNTIAMTMGTSGCEKHDLVINQKEQEYFTELNYENIVAEMAEGRGEYLTAFAGVMGCNANSFNASSQANLESLAGSNAQELLSNVKAQIASNPSACL